MGKSDPFPQMEGELGKEVKELRFARLLLRFFCNKQKIIQVTILNDCSTQLNSLSQLECLLGSQGKSSCV